MNYRDSFEENHMKKIRIWISSAHSVRKSIKNLIKKERKRIKGEEEQFHLLILQEET